jgi:hypothetical protein
MEIAEILGYEVKFVKLWYNNSGIKKGF